MVNERLVADLVPVLGLLHSHLRGEILHVGALVLQLLPMVFRDVGESMGLPVNLKERKKKMMKERMNPP